jgi:hypothetical protein
VYGFRLGVFGGVGQFRFTGPKNGQLSRAGGSTGMSASLCSAAECAGDYLQRGPRCGAPPSPRKKKFCCLLRSGSRGCSIMRPKKKRQHGSTASHWMFKAYLSFEWSNPRRCIPESQAKIRKYELYARVLIYKRLGAVWPSAFIGRVDSRPCIVGIANFLAAFWAEERGCQVCHLVFPQSLHVCVDVVSRCGTPPP